MGRVVEVPQLTDMHPLDLVLAPAEERGPRRIDASEIAVEVGNTEQVFGNLPDPITLADALGNFRLQPFIQNA